MNEFTNEELEKAHDDNGYCRSCGWHAWFYEMAYEPTGKVFEDSKEWWDSCKNDNEEDNYSHRGCYVYTSINHE